MIPTHIGAYFLHDRVKILRTSTRRPTCDCCHRQTIVPYHYHTVYAKFDTRRTFAKLTEIQPSVADTYTFRRIFLHDIVKILLSNKRSPTSNWRRTLKVVSSHFQTVYVKFDRRRNFAKLTEIQPSVVDTYTLRRIFSIWQWKYCCQINASPLATGGTGRR